MSPEELKEKFSKRFPNHGENCIIDKGHVVATIPLSEKKEVIKTLKEEPEFEFDLYMDLTVVDWMERKPRFDLVYHLYSVKHNYRIRLKIGIEDGKAAPTLTDLYPIANWYEREMWDLYGIKFSGHPNLKRILLYEEFKGHPLRKDYPYDKRQPLIPENMPGRDSQVSVKNLTIHRGQD